MSLLPFISNGGRRAIYPTIFVDSVSGNDANNGTTPAQALATLTAGQAAAGVGSAVGASRGGSWNQQFTNVLDNVAVVSYGSGNTPVLDAMDAAGVWTQPDSITYPNVWSTTVSHSVALTISRLLIAENDVLLPRQTSIALVNSNAGSHYCPHDGALPTNNPATIYVHATGSGNPNSNGKTYKISTKGGITLGNNARVSGIFTNGSANNNGSIYTLRNARISKSLMAFGGKHHMVVGGGAHVTDCAAFIPDIPLGSDGGQFPFTAYDDDGTGFNAMFQRCIAGAGAAITQPGTPISRGGFYAHSQSPKLWNEVTYEQCACLDLLSVPDFSAGDTNSLLVRGTFSRGADVALGVGGSAWTRNATFEYNQAFRTQTSFAKLTPSGSSAVNVRNNAIRPWTWGLTRKLIETNASVTGAFENNVFASSAKYVFAQFGGVVTHRYNIYITNDSGAAWVVMTLPNGSVSDYNIYVNLGSADLQFIYNGVTYTGLAAYQAATGQEAHSLYFKNTTLADIFNGTVDNGDFRLKPSGTIGGSALALGAGPQSYWNWNTRGIASGPPVLWPDVPETVAEGKTFIENPTGWVY